MNCVLVILFCVSLMTENSFQNDGHCAFGSYPPSDKNEIPTYIINLDLPPKERWTELARAKKSEIRELVDHVKNALLGRLTYFVDILFPHVLKTLPSSYADEIVGVSEATGIPLGEIVLFNLMYEIVMGCTSIVAQDKNGEILHGRNMDFGLFMGWDKKRWTATEILKRMVVNTVFQKNGQTVYRSTQFSGYVGVLTGIKPGLFSLSVNAKKELFDWHLGFLERVLGFRKGEWLGVLTRRVLEDANSYSEAQNELTNAPLIAPVYFILAGNKTGQGSIITRQFTTAQVNNLGNGNGNGSWFLVQTNYDHWVKPPVVDDRVTPATRCLEKLSRENLSLAGVTEVLTTKPVLNKLTVYITVMKPSEDEMETYLPECDEPCALWG